MSGRRWAFWVACAVLLVTLLGGAYVAKNLLEGGAATTIPQTPLERNVLKLLNVQRVRYGLPKLTYSPGLAKLARAHTADMLKHNYFAHDEPHRRTYAVRVGPYLRSPGIRELAENIAWGTGSYGTAQGLVTSWMNSPPHRANILSPALHRTGLGITKATSRYQGQVGAVLATDEFSN